ncbi:DUF4012 domain-containing protein [Kineosporia rhizophila]|uniref:DUF4012 domain-containing protein n=1 Tax=Kineosporia TaxID=49184 RepID=UPI001E5DB208|nr:DUF4012 domain-containing protein [Kineosporia sp. NBRC 101677]MCE0540202.1 DUF4012 domain-containing protein [Kineosporia rhizophila]GLY17247.1 hypothetical protein Kisp01_42620 [Kineosporia sp. NBRC 101677]
MASAAGVLVVVGAGGWLAFRAREAQAAVEALRADGKVLQAQLEAYDLAAAGETLGKVREDAHRAERLTGDPVWGIAGYVPVLGRDLHAARRVSSVMADITTAAQPLESALPRLTPKGTSGNQGQLDTQALEAIGAAMPELSAAVSSGAVEVGELDAGKLRPEVADGVNTLSSALDSARGPFADSVPMLQQLPTMLGSDGPKTWLVLLQQDAEARGTGGLVGAFAELRTHQGRMKLADAESRSKLDRGPAIPAVVAPDGLRRHYGRDLTEWAGFNASPHFPHTGVLAAEGWKARTRQQADFVAGVDQNVVAAMLAATGPVRVRGVQVDSANAVQFLSRGVYARWSDPQEVDAVTTELVEAVFGKFSSGEFSLPTLIKSLRDPVRERRLLLWASDEDVQSQLEQLSISGTIPDDPGPFAMTVINNGGGNKMDAYLQVDTKYDPGTCTNSARNGQISVTLDNTAPKDGEGLPSYVNVRTDLLQRGITGKQTRDGSNRIVLDIYGPVGSTAVLTQLDGETIVPVTGLDNNHPVWRLSVPIAAGQQRTVNVVMSTPVVEDDAGQIPVVLNQPMVKPATSSAEPLTACKTSSVVGG